ncbi:hypothetical protein K0M31_020302 [Melipona bicolor]|uniref:Uncharacterized protein n=1 Tax=Melipona bicolor TaxID=60889 RepID=A0AA40G1S9_9HYME|nr:hypothetical protein K0M31_020302 [Melipona bicolor]
MSLFVVARNGQREAGGRVDRRPKSADSGRRQQDVPESKECSRCNAPPNELALFCGACMCMLHAAAASAASTAYRQQQQQQQHQQQQQRQQQQQHQQQRSCLRPTHVA